jgi:NADPH-dependent glutamate synthase beta subunit-like oxidoreductase
MKSSKLNIPGEDMQGVIHGVDYLMKINLGEKVPLGDRVAVIGGGNVAMDAVRTATRMGSKDVFILYRRTRAEMPASPRRSKRPGRRDPHGIPRGTQACRR